MAIDFPANPTNGQVYANYIYDSSITAWRNVNTDTGIGTLNAMGLKNVVPTSVQVGSGSATVNANGTVTFTSVTSLSLNNIFTSTYKNYRVVINLDTSPALSGAQMKLRASGTDVSSNYGIAGWYAYMSTSTAAFTTGGGITRTAMHTINTTATGGATVIADIANPALTKPTQGQFIQTMHDGDWQSGLWNVIHTLANAYDGITLNVLLSNISGSIQIFGYNN